MSLSPSQPDGMIHRARSIDIDARIRQARIGSGLILFLYVATHFTNHALGLHSIEAMEAGRELFVLFWRSAVPTILLYGAILVHIALALQAIVMRDKLRSMSAQEIGQLAGGLILPYVLFEHVIATRLMYEMLGFEARYAFVLLVQWVDRPEQAFVFTAALIIAWGHGCIGIHFWLRYRSWYRQHPVAMFALAILVPAASIVGYIDAGIDLQVLARDAAWVAEQRKALGVFTPEDFAWFTRTVAQVEWTYLGLVAAAFALRWARVAFMRGAADVTVGYGNGHSIRVEPGTSVLDASRRLGEPHASVCGGRGRCSTCRVRVSRGLEDLPEPMEAEKKVLERVGAPPNVRLACQIRPTTAIEVTPLLPPRADVAESEDRPGYLQGQERDLVVLFADMRGFTAMSEAKLPYDVVFILNRYFADMGEAVEQAGGRIDKFIGDGVMALFGINTSYEEACRQALHAADGMARSLESFNAGLGPELPAPMRIAIGVHGGPSIVGEMGFGGARTLTAVGDTVNTASRLESLAKQRDCQLAISETVLSGAGISLADIPAEDLTIRGRTETLVVRLLETTAPVAAAIRGR